ncbi:MAG: hypothetical protein LBL55_10160, partial [Propionibacteriaceae bacterium]|nr:hypothetical protein [Propionibacteriaceae bacterium]
RIGPAAAELVRRLDQSDEQIGRSQIEANAEIRDHNARLTGRLSERLLGSLPAWLNLPAELTRTVAQLEPSLAPAVPVARPNSARRALGGARDDWDD